MSLLLWTVLTTSLLGSLHCAAMCGPFVAFYAGTDREASWPSHVAYNGGRLITYMTLGAVAGGIGAAADFAGGALHLQRVAALLAGGVIIAWGAVALARALGVRVPELPVGLGPAKRGLVKLRTRPPVVRASVLGLLTAALPCGWLYAFVLAAGSTGSPMWGALTMAAFWAGTVPMMLGLGLGLRRVSRALGRRMPILTAVALLVVGVAALTVRVPRIGATPHQGAATESAIDYVKSVGDEPPSCHGDH